MLPDAGRLDRIGAVDLVVGVPGCANGETVRAARRVWQDVLQAFQPSPRAVLVHADPGTAGEPEDAQAAGAGTITLLYAPIVDAAQPELLGTAYSDTVRVVMQIAQRLDARTMGVLGTLSTAIEADEAVLLVRPVIEQRADLMVSRHDARRTEGLITRGIFGPLTRALFGIRLHDPMVVNFAASGALAARTAGRAGNGQGPAAVWLANDAACAGLRMGEACIRRPGTAPAHADLGTLFTTLLGSLFADVERHAACWQRLHAPRPVTSAGEPRAACGEAPAEVPAVDTARMVESFRSAFSSLAGVWSMLLPPATLLELKKLSALPAGQFHLRDELWARIVFDVALGHRLRTISRDHLLRSFVPLYLAWVASWVMQPGGDAAAESQQERLCMAFEQQKPYLLSRWRWPDRFSP